MSQPPTSTLQTRLTKRGSGLALVSDKAVLELVGIDEHTQLANRTDGRCLIVSPTEGDRPARVRASMATLHGKYARALEKLAE